MTLPKGGCPTIGNFSCFKVFKVGGGYAQTSVTVTVFQCYQVSKSSQLVCSEEIRSSLFVTVCCAGIHLQRLLELLPGVAGNSTKFDN